MSAPDPRLVAEIAAQPHRFVFATVVGEHLYGFAGADSDLDVRAAHVIPPRELLGLRTPSETLAYTAHRDGLDFEVVSLDVGRLCLSLLKKNGNVLEHICSPLVVHSTPEHVELIEIARACASQHMAHHFLSHARRHWELIQSRPRVRGILYAFRVLLTGTHLMRTGEVEASLPRLNEYFGLGYVADLTARCVADTGLDPSEIDFFSAENERLRAGLEAAKHASTLPPLPPPEIRDRLDDWLVRIRLG